MLLDPRPATSPPLGGADTPAGVFAQRPALRARRRARHRRSGRAASASGCVHRRLSIVDLSPAGHQPMCDADGRPAGSPSTARSTTTSSCARELEALGDALPRHQRHRGDPRRVPALGPRLPGALQRHVRLRAVGRERAASCSARATASASSRSTTSGTGAASRSPPSPRRWCSRSRAASAPRLEAVRDLLALDWVDHDAAHVLRGRRTSCRPGTAWWSGESGARGRALVDARSGAPRAGDARRSATRASSRELFTDAVRAAAARRRRGRLVPLGRARLERGRDHGGAPAAASPIHAFTCAYDEGPPSTSAVRGCGDGRGDRRRARTWSCPTAATSGRCSTAWR